MDIYLKQASPTAANIHNRWWRERSERNLRIFTAKPSRRPRRWRTQASCKYTPYVRPLRGRFHHHHGGPQASQPSAAQPAVMDIRPLRGRSLANRHRKEKQIVSIVSIVSIVVKTSAREEHKQGKDDFSIIHG